MGHTLHEFGHPQPGLLTLAIVAQILSLRAYSEMVGRLLARAGLPLGQWPLGRMTLGGVALTASVPGGAAASVAYWYRRLRAEGADPGTALYGLAGAAIAGAVSLAVLVVAGIVVVGGDGPVRDVRLPVLAAVAALGVLGLAARRPIRRRLASLSDRLTGERQLRPQPFGQSAVAIVGLASANWLLDLATLYLSLRAVGANVPANAIVLVYGIGQIVQSVPLLPGGGGTVEASLALAFAAFGHTTGSVVAGVLLYRMINTWGLVPIGWAAMAFDARRFLRPVWRRRLVQQPT